MQFKEFKTRNGSLLSFSEITLGTSPLGDLFSKLDEVAAQETVRAAYLAGVRAFDTSPHYGNGLAEARIGAALRNKPRNDLVISTKVGRWMDPVTPASNGAQAPSLDLREVFPTVHNSTIPMTARCGRSNNPCCGRASAILTSC